MKEFYMNKPFHENQMAPHMYKKVQETIMPKLQRIATRNSGVLVTVEETKISEEQAVYTVVSDRVQRGGLISFKAKYAVLRDVLGITRVDAPPTWQGIIRLCEEKGCCVKRHGSKLIFIG